MTVHVAAVVDAVAAGLDKVSHMERTTIERFLLTAAVVHLEAVGTVGELVLVGIAGVEVNFGIEERDVALTIVGKVGWTGLEGNFGDSLGSAVTGSDAHVAHVGSLAWTGMVEGFALKLQLLVCCWSDHQSFEQFAASVVDWNIGKVERSVMRSC